jgi:thioredoxin-dependent peroxiredoxin
MAEERIGEAFEGDVRLTVVGRQLRPGEAAPEFVLEHLDPKDSSIRIVRLADSAGKVRLLNVINSIDTPVCHVETCRWERHLSELPPGVVLYTVAMDLPFALARWQAAQNSTHPALSGHRDEDFGRDYGVLLKEWRLLQRAVFVIDRKDRVVYAEYVADQMREPDYAAALEAVRGAASESRA